MAYKNLVAQICTGKADWFTRLRDFMCARDATHTYSTTGIGWTLHDSSYTVDEDNPQLGDWFVVFSAGESGKETLYYRVEWGEDYIIALGYSYWDNSAHSGTNQYGATWGSLNLDETGESYDIYVYGDLDFVSFLETLEDTYDAGACIGKLSNNKYDTTPAVCSSSITAGSDVTVTLDTIPSGWVAGETKILVRHQDTVERCLVKTISSNDITVDLINSYSANAVFQEMAGYIVNGSLTGLVAGNSILYNCLDTGDLTTAISLSAGNEPFSNAQLDPEFLYDKYVVSEIMFSQQGETTQQYYGEMPNMIRRSANLSEKTTHTLDGDSYRMIKIYNGEYLGFLEV